MKAISTGMTGTSFLFSFFVIFTSKHGLLNRHLHKKKNIYTKKKLNTLKYCFSGALFKDASRKNEQTVLTTQEIRRTIKKKKKNCNPEDATIAPEQDLHPSTVGRLACDFRISQRGLGSTKGLP